MCRNLITFSLCALLVACSSPSDKPVLSGLMWGGEGNRLILTSASTSNVADTITINHLGEFSWQPDTFASGFYRIEKPNGEGLTLILDYDNPVYIDAQHVSFPQRVNITGSDETLTFYELETNSEQWATAISEVSSITKEEDWTPSKNAIDELKEKVDSINLEYKNKALNISSTPLSTMYALLQKAGNHNLFHPWHDRGLFLQTDSLLKDKMHIKEVAKFSEQTQILKKYHKIISDTQPGKEFPELDLLTAENQEVELTTRKGKPRYIEMHFSDFENFSTQSHLNTLQQIKNMGMEVSIIISDSNENSIPQNWSEYSIYKFRNANPLIHKEILPQKLNFLINADGIIEAKNIWNNELLDVTQILINQISQIEPELIE